MQGYIDDKNIEFQKLPHITKNITNTLAIKVLQTISPYPIVVIVTIEYQREFLYELKAVLRVLATGLSNKLIIKAK